MLTYFLQVNLCWLLFYGLYYALLSRETFFTLNRIYLIISLLAGLILPFAADWLRAETPLVMTFDSILLPTFVVSIKGQVHAAILPLNTLAQDSITEGGRVWAWWTIFKAIYFIGIGIMSLRFLMGLFHIFTSFKTANLDKKDGFFIAYTEGVSQPFSFFNFIFINTHITQDIDFQNIIQHEKAHVQQKHLFDVVFLELLNIVFWCSPFIYLYKNSLRIVHEYLADAAVLRSVSKRQYGTLLIQQAQSGKAFALANPFFSQLKKRIIMMTRNPSKRQALVKYAFAAPVFLLLVSFLATPNNIALKSTEAVSNTIHSTISGDKVQVKNLNLSNSSIISTNIAETNISKNDTKKSNLYAYISFSNNKTNRGGIIPKSIMQALLDGGGLILGNNEQKLYRIVQFDAHKISNSGSISKRIVNEGNVFSEAVKALGQTAEIGDEFYFSAILVSKNYSQNFENLGTLRFAIGEKMDVFKDNSETPNTPFYEVPPTKNSIEILQKDTTKKDPIMVFSEGYVQGLFSVKSMKAKTSIVGFAGDKNVKDKKQRKLEVLSFTLTKTSANGGILSVNNNSDNFSAETQSLIASAQVGDTYIFSNVKMKKADNTIVEAGNSRFDINSLEGDSALNINLADKNGMPASAKSPNKDGVYTIVEEQPQFPQGMKALFAWLGQNIKYPAVSRENGVQGTVYVGFVVETDGSISNIQVKRGVKGVVRDTITVAELNGMKGIKVTERPDYSIDNEAKRVIAAMPKWIPGKSNGQPVRVAYTLPLKFKLE